MYEFEQTIHKLESYQRLNKLFDKYNETSEELRTAADRTVAPSKLTVKLKETESKMLKTAFVQCKSTREYPRSIVFPKKVSRGRW
jgi:ribosomal protein S3AE